MDRCVDLKGLEPRCHRMPPDMRSSDEYRYPRKLTLEMKAAGIVYLNFDVMKLGPKHFFRVELRRSVLQPLQTPAILKEIVTNPLHGKPMQRDSLGIRTKFNMASGGGIIKGVKGFFQKPAVKTVVKTLFPDPMANFKYSEVLWNFRNKETLEQWTLITDEQFGGKSTAEFVRSPGGKAVFKGNISTELPAATNVKYSGMCSIRSQPQRVSFVAHLVLYAKFKLKVT